jgi:hypothetical protein
MESKRSRRLRRFLLAKRAEQQTEPGSSSQGGTQASQNDLALLLPAASMAFSLSLDDDSLLQDEHSMSMSMPLNPMRRSTSVSSIRMQPSLSSSYDDLSLAQSSTDASNGVPVTSDVDQVRKL